VFRYGFADQSRLMRLATGTTAGFAAVSSLVGLLWLSHLLVFEGGCSGDEWYGSMPRFGA